jgi:hypothetical protein
LRGSRKQGEGPVIMGICARIERNVNKG